MAKSKHKTQDQDQADQNDQIQDRRAHNTPRIFGTSRHQPEDEPPTLLGWDGLARKGIRYHHNHLRRLWEAGKFPKPIKISERRLAWTEELLDRWISEKIAAGE